jgi:hypothetical protein
VVKFVNKHLTFHPFFQNRLEGLFFNHLLAIGVLSMKPVFVPHSDYQAFVLKQLRTHFGPGIVIINKDWPLVAKFWMTDLSPITTLLRDAYSDRGPDAKDPASLFRCYLIYLMRHPEKGLTEWVNILKRTPIYAILSGFAFDELPGVGTFYDFFKRLWPAVDKNLKPKKQPKRKARPKKGKKGEKTPISKPGRVKRLVEWMLRHGTRKTELPADRLFDFFQTQILSVSASLGLLGDGSALTTAGDGTPIVTSAYTRSKPTCDCRAQGLAIATILVFTPSPIATPAGTAPEKSTLTDTTFTWSLRRTANTIYPYTPDCILLPGMMRSVWS